MTNTLENTGILHAGQMTDHANNADTENGKKLNYLKNNGKIFIPGLARRVQHLSQLPQPGRNGK
ncbi:transposase [Pseudomonas chlororaphis]